MDKIPPAMIQRQARALRIVTCLQSGPGFSANELARHVNVSRRTIFRDLRLIRAAGINFFYDKEDEAYRLAAPAPRLAPPGLGEEDLAQLVAATRLSPLQHFAQFSVGLRESVTRLLSVHPYRVSASVSRLLNACALRPPKRAFPADAEKTLLAIFQAIRTRRQLRVTLQPSIDGAAHTKFSPYRVIASLDEWVVVGRSSFHRCTKALPLRAIQNAQQTGDSYSVPRGFRFRQSQASP
jgi:predicted DNA-binding transcriptional regulator YafY